MARPEIHALLVEDEDADAIYVEKMLARSEDVSFKVSHVTTLKSALQMVAFDEPDIVLLDLSLPDTHGYDTVTEFVKHASHVPFVVMTGNDDLQMAMRTIGLGAQDYIIKGESQPKPLERSLLVAVRRAAKEQVNRHLDYLSHHELFDGDEGVDASLSVIRPHVSQLIEAIEDLTSFIGRNAPGILADVRALMDKHDAEVTIQALRDTLRLYADRKASTRRAFGRKPSKAAMRAVRSVLDRPDGKSIPPASNFEADATLLDILSRRDRSDRGFDD